MIKNIEPAIPMNHTNMTLGDVSVTEAFNKTALPIIRHPFGQEPIIPQEIVQKVVFIFAILIIPVAAFGCIGNVLSLLVLVHHRMRNTTNYCLAALAMSDFLLLAASLWYSTIIIYKSRDRIAAENLRRLTYPWIGAYGSVVTARITTWMTTLLSIERFVAVYCPIKARTICGKRHTVVSIILIYLLAMVAFIPHALKYYSVTIVNNNITMVKLKKTLLGENKQFCAIYGTILNVLFRFLPIGLLIILNILIVKAIRRTWNLRRIMSKNGNHCNISEQNRITIMLLIVSCVFLGCILPGALHSIASKIWPHYSRMGAKRNLYACISCVTYFLETVNSSINFVIYMAFSAKFCRTYQEIFCCKRPSISKQSSRQTYQFSRRPLMSTASTGSQGSSHDSRMTVKLADRRRHQFGINRCSAVSSFDMESIKLLGAKGKQASSESEISMIQYS